MHIWRRTKLTNKAIENVGCSIKRARNFLHRQKTPASLRNNARLHYCIY